MQAHLWGWSISTYNIIVEGIKDVGHFQLADKLHYVDTSLRLLDERLSVVAVGEGDKGGTKGMLSYFPVLRDVLSTDPKDYNEIEFKFIVLLDSDPKGKHTAGLLTGSEIGFVLNRDVFLLQRVLPRGTRDPKQFQRSCLQLNAPWSSLDCEIEDLVGESLLERFLNMNRGYCKKPTARANGGHHYDWAIHAKAPLLRFIENEATLRDMQLTVDVLKSLRYLLGLEPDGSPTPSRSG